MLYLAIDQHRRQLTVNVRNEAGDVVLRRQVSTQWEKVRQFFADLRADSEAEWWLRGDLGAVRIQSLAVEDAR